MRILPVVLFLSVCACAGADSIPTATWNEVGSSVATIIQATRLGNEALVDVLSAALEVEKKATVPHRAQAIGAAIRRTAGISHQQFIELRTKHSFFDLAIACALASARKMSVISILQERELGVWQEILPRFLEKSPERAASLIATLEGLLK